MTFEHQQASTDVLEKKMTDSTEWIGQCRMCNWSTQTLPNEVLAGMQAFVHERVEDYQHDVQVVQAAH